MTTQTQKTMHGGEQVRKIPCDKPIARQIMSTLIRAKVKHISASQRGVMVVRWFRCLEAWWLRGTSQVDDDEEESMESLNDFKSFLKWDNVIDNEFFDRDGTSVLMYAVVKTMSTL